MSSYLLLTRGFIIFFFKSFTFYHITIVTKKSCVSAGVFHQNRSKKLLDLQQKLQNQAEWPKLGNELLGQDLKERQAL